MIEAVQSFGGRLTMRAYQDRQVPYEMNTTLFCALKGTLTGRMICKCRVLSRHKQS